MHHSTTFLCSSCESVGLSPVVPTGTSPLVPSVICQSTMLRKASSSTPPFLKGVTSAVNDPRKLVLAAMTRSLRCAEVSNYRFDQSGGSQMILGRQPATPQLTTLKSREARRA